MITRRVDMSLVRLREKKQITLSNQIVRDHRLKSCDMFDVDLVGRTLRLTPKVLVTRHQKRVSK